MLLKCCTQNVSKLGKFSSGHRIGKGQFSFQSQRKTMPNNVQTIVQLHSFHVRKVMLKILQVRPQQYVNFQMYKLDLEKAEEPEINCQHQLDYWKRREFQKNIYFGFIDYAKAFDCVVYKKLWKILQEIEIPDHHTCLLRNLYAGQEATVRTVHGTTN